MLAGPSQKRTNHETCKVSGPSSGRDHWEGRVRKALRPNQRYQRFSFDSDFCFRHFTQLSITGLGSAVPCENPGACVVCPALRLDRADRLRGLSLNSACGRSLTAVCRDEPDSPAPRGPLAAQRSQRHRRFTATVAAACRRGPARSIQPSNPRRHKQDSLRVLS